MMLAIRIAAFIMHLASVAVALHSYFAEAYFVLLIAYALRVLGAPVKEELPHG